MATKSTSKKTVKESTVDVKPKATKKTTAKTKETVKKETVKKETVKKAVTKKTTTRKTTKKKEELVVKAEDKKEEVIVETKYEDTRRRSVVFIGSECYPFVKTGGLGDVMYALPKQLVKQNCDVKVMLPRYKCIDQKWQDKMVYRGSFYMDLTSDGCSYYVGIMEYVSEDGVVYDFIDNEDFFTSGNPYTSIIGDIPKYCFFAKACLAALNYMDWVPNIIHCHDWQTGLVPVFLREFFKNTAIASAKVVYTIHNLKFQGIFNVDTFRYWTSLPYEVLYNDALRVNRDDVNMLKAGISYCDELTTVSETYANEIQGDYGEFLDGHIRYYSYKVRGIVNGIDTDIWNPKTDSYIVNNYDKSNVLEAKKANKLALQEELGLEKDENKIMIGLISRLTDQKGLDLINEIVGDLIDGNTQIVVLGSGDPYYESSFRYYEEAFKGSFCANIMYDEGRAHKIYSAADALLIPSAFEPCGLTQLIGMHYGSVPIVRETGGLKDTVEPYNEYEQIGNGFTFDKYDAGLLLDAINRCKTVYFTQKDSFNAMVKRDMEKDVSWEKSAALYKKLYLELTNW